MNRIKRIIKTLIDIAISPLSPVLTLAIGWILTISVTTANVEFPHIINVMIENRKMLFWLVFGWLIVAFAYKFHVDTIAEIKQENAILKAKITEKDRQLNTSSGIILNKFGEFARFKRIAMFEEAMRVVVDNSLMVESAQLYSYSILNYQRNKIRIKLNAVAGYAQEGVVINNILQTYYELKKDVYERVRFIVELWKQVNNEALSWEQKNLKSTALVENSTSLFSELKRELREIGEPVVLLEGNGEIYYNDYRVLTVLYQLMNSIDDLNVLTDLLTEKEDRDNLEKQTRIKNLEDELYKGKRTGLLGSIILEDVFMFRHVGKSSKHGRLYIAFTLEISKQNYCILFTASASQVDELSSNEQLRRECEKLKVKFVEIMRNLSNDL